jgi:DNA-binding CsgD family transcriptional regulator
MKQVGTLMGITPRTVAFHKYRAMELLGIRSSAALVRYAVDSGLVGRLTRSASPAAGHPRAS